MTRIEGEDFVIESTRGKELKQTGARWDARLKAWRMPATQMNATILRELEFDPPPRGGGVIPLVTDERLLPHQRRAVERLVQARHGELKAVFPGGGKTFIAVAAADLSVPDDRVVVVAPASLLKTWEAEIRKWQRVPGDVYVVQGKLDYDHARDARWIVMSWDKMTREADSFGIGWPVLVLDESVLAKSRGSKRFKTLQKIRRGFARVWLLSGSPTTRYPDDLWAQLHVIWPRAFPSYWRFAERYCTVEETPWARVVTGARAGRNAAEENSDLIDVVTEDDAGLDLPEYLFEPPVLTDMRPKQARAYRSMAKDFIAELGDGTQVVSANEAAKLTRLQQIASWWDGESGKHDAVADLIRSFEPPYLIWTHWRDGAQALRDRLEDIGVDARLVNGGTRDRDEEEWLAAFKAGTLEALVLSLGVGKFGHTFTKTRTIIGVDRTFMADDLYQSSFRVRRIGLEHRPVWVPVVAAGTVDELTVGDNIEAKLTSISKITRADLASLLKGMGR